jgi:hypothetical protein
MRKRCVVAMTAGCVFALGLAQAAEARSAYCSASGDVCFGVLQGSPVRLNLSLQAKYFSRYKLCVTTPAGSRTCRRFSVHLGSHGAYSSTVRWSTHFPNAGSGTYRARWFSGGSALGPSVTFKR